MTQLKANPFVYVTTANFDFDEIRTKDEITRAACAEYLYNPKIARPLGCSTSSLTTESSIWFTSIQTAGYLNISVQALMNMTSNGKIPYRKLGRRNRYNKSDLDHLLESNRKGPQ